MTTGQDSPATTNMADDEDAQPEVLQPCAVCRRKFNPRSLEKHVKICERSAARKRKPFDSLKQRIQGTELAEFLPKKPSPPPVEPRYQYEDRPIRQPTHAWKQTRDEFLRAIRAARGHNDTSPSQHHQYYNQQQHGSSSHSGQGLQQRPSTLSLVTAPGVPMRANEKGQCPTCLRQFGVKSYERHVAFCKERSTRLPASPQIGNNVAKERFEARMKYRAPGLRNKRPTNREKYSPGSLKTVANSPVLPRKPTKESSSTPTKSSENLSPKLPVLKRPAQLNKESLNTSATGPLKSRPKDRSNRSPDSQDSSTPSTLRQFFNPRRLVALSDVFPSKILQSKKSQLSSSPQKYSTKLVSNFLQQEFIDSSPEANPDSTQKKIKKKLKLKCHKNEKKENNKIHEKEQRKDLALKKIQEDDMSNKDNQSVDNEDDHNLSDVTSSMDEETYSTAEYELNEALVSQNNTENSEYFEKKTDKLEPTDAVLLTSGNEINENSIHNNDSSNEAINQLYFAKSKNSLRNINIYGMNNIENYESDGGMSNSSTKTFRKSDHSFNNINYIDYSDLCNLYKKNVVVEFSANKKIDKSIDKPTSPNFKDNESMDKNMKNRLSSLSKKIKDKYFPKKFNSMPNILETKANNVAETKNIESNSESMKISMPSDENAERIDNESELEQLKGLNRRCATYVIDEGRDYFNHQQHQQRVNDDSSEEKPLKKRRKLQRRCKGNVVGTRTEEDEAEAEDEEEDEDDDDDDNENDGDRGSSKNEMHGEDINNVPETQSPDLNENKTMRNVPETPPKSFPDFDYRNKNASFSKPSTPSTDNPISEIEDQFEDDTESNASELIKEIDVEIMRSGMHINLDKFEIPFEAHFLSYSNKMRELELSAKNSLSQRKEKSKKARRGSGKKDEETWISTVELSSLSNERVDKATQYFEKEICTITRLDSVHPDESFLPSIGARSSALTPDWKERVEYHREKLVKSKPKARVLELENLREDEMRDEIRKPQEQYPLTRITPHIRRLSKLGWRSFERLPGTNWSSYGCRHPDFSMILRDRIGVSKDYDPFLLAEQQLNDLFSDTSDQSSTDGSSAYPSRKPSTSPSLPLSHSSAFAKYPSLGTVQLQVQQTSTPEKPQQRGSLIAPPSGFDDPTSSDLSSDCTDSQSVSREVLRSPSISSSLGASRTQPASGEREHVLGRRIIIDQNQALGVGEFAPLGDNKRPARTTNGSFSRLARPAAPSSRSLAAPKLPERKISSSSSSGSSDLSRGGNNKTRSKANSNSNSKSNSNSNLSLNGSLSQQRVNSDLKSFNGSNMSLSSIISATDMEIKRSNSLFDELLSTFEDETTNSTPTLPSLMTSFMRNEPSVSLSSKSPSQNNGLNGILQNSSVNGRINCSDDDGDSSSPESVKRQENGGKLSADSAYSSLNRKHSNYVRNASESISSSAIKMSKFCHQCGFKFPDSAKFCCDCGMKRLCL